MASESRNFLSLSVLFPSQISPLPVVKENITTTKEARLPDMILFQPQTECDGDTWIIIHELTFGFKTH